MQEGFRSSLLRGGGDKVKVQQVFDSAVAVREDQIANSQGVIDREEGFQYSELQRVQGCNEGAEEAVAEEGEDNLKTDGCPLYNSSY